MRGQLRRRALDSEPRNLQSARSADASRRRRRRRRRVARVTARRGELRRRALRRRALLLRRRALLRSTRLPAPARAVRAALVMVFSFAIIYTVGFDKVYPVEKLPFSALPADALLNRFAVSLFLSVSAFTSGFGDLRESVMDWLNIPLVIEALLGTLLWGLFIVAFGRKVVR